jgi:hypothetical protein
MLRRGDYGPTVVAYRGIAENPERLAALDTDLAAPARRFDVGGGAMEWEYLLLTATSRGRRLVSCRQRLGGTFWLRRNTLSGS